MLNHNWLLVIADIFVSKAIRIMTEDHVDDHYDEIDESDDGNEDEYKEENCHYCGEENVTADMVNCPQCEEDLDEDGIIPGWICKGCCEQLFLENPKDCIDTCGNDEVILNIKKHPEKCLNLSALKKTEVDGQPVYINDGNNYYVSLEAQQAFERFKPLNVVDSIFIDQNENYENASIVYAKDNLGNITSYSIQFFKELKELFKIFNYWGLEMFNKPDGPIVMLYQNDELSIGAVLAPQEMQGDGINAIGLEILERIKEKRDKAEDFFGVQIIPNHENLKEQLQLLSEDELINQVLVPMLDAMGFKNVKSISFHGPGEAGGDFHPFYKTGDFSKIIYYSAQVKAVKIHCKSGVKEGNVNQIIDQMKKLFRTPFKAFIDNTEKRITHAFVFCSQDIIGEARDQLFNAFHNKQHISLVEIDDIVKAVNQHNLTDQVMTYCNNRKKDKK